MVRIWVAIYSLYPAVLNYSKAVADQKQGKGSKKAVIESQVGVFKTICDFLTYVLSHVVCAGPVIMTVVGWVFSIGFYRHVMSAVGMRLPQDTIKCCFDSSWHQRFRLWLI